MIDCPNGEIRERLPDLVHDQLTGAARAEVSAHVAGCAACAAEVALLRDLRASLRVAPSVDVSRIVASLPPPPVAGRIGGRLGRRARQRVDWRVAAAATLLAAGVGSAVIWDRAGRDSGAGATRVAGEQAARTDTVMTDAAPQRVAVATLSIDADLGEASDAELEALLRDLESFDGLPAGEPEPALVTPGDGELDR